MRHGRQGRLPLHSWVAARRCCRHDTGQIHLLNLRANRRLLLGAGGLVVLATLAAYHRFSGPLIFDDSSAITDNPSLRRLWPPAAVFSPPADCTLGGRPFANLTFALNYAWSRWST